MKTEENLNLSDVIKLAKENPKGTQLTSKIEEYVDEKGNKITKFKIFA